MTGSIVEDVAPLRALARAVLARAVADTLIPLPSTEAARNNHRLTAVDPQGARDWLLDPDEDDRAWLHVLVELADVSLSGIQRVIESGDVSLIGKLARRLYRETAPGGSLLAMPRDPGASAPVPRDPGAAVPLGHLPERLRPRKYDAADLARIRGSEGGELPR